MTSTVSSSARIGASVQLGENVTIDDFAIVGSDDPNRPTRIGDGCVIRSGTVIYEGVTLSAGVRTGHYVLIRTGTTIGADAIVGTHAVIDGSSTIGTGVSLQSGVYIPPGTSIDDHCFIGPNAVLTNDKRMGSFVRNILTRDTLLQGPKLERAVRVGANATILPEVTLGEECVVAAGAVVVDDVPPRHIVSGVPARFLAEVPDDQLHPSTRNRS